MTEKKKQSSLSAWLKSATPSKHKTATFLGENKENELKNQNSKASRSNLADKNDGVVVTADTSSIPQSQNETSSSSSSKSIERQISSSSSSSSTSNSAKRLTSSSSSLNPFKKSVEALPELTPVETHKAEMIMKLTWIHDFCVAFGFIFENLVIPKTLQGFSEWLLHPYEHYENLLKLYYEILSSASMCNMLQNKNERNAELEDEHSDESQDEDSDDGNFAESIENADDNAQQHRSKTMKTRNKDKRQVKQIRKHKKDETDVDLTLVPREVEVTLHKLNHLGLSDSFGQSEFMNISFTLHVNILKVLIEDALLQSYHFGEEFQTHILEEQVQEKRSKWACNNEIKTLETKRTQLEEAYNQSHLKIAKLKTSNELIENDAQKSSSSNRTNKEDQDEDNEMKETIGEKASSIATTIEKRKRAEKERKARKEKLDQLEKEKNLLQSTLNKTVNSLNKLYSEQARTLKQIHNLNVKARNTSVRCLGRDRFGRLYWYLGLDKNRFMIFVETVPKQESIVDHEVLPSDTQTAVSEIAQDETAKELNNEDADIAKWTMVTTVKQFYKLKHRLSDTSNCEKALKRTLFTLVQSEYNWDVYKRVKLNISEKKETDDAFECKLNSWLNWFNNDSFEHVDTSLITTKNQQAYNDFFKTSIRIELVDLQERMTSLLKNLKNEIEVGNVSKQGLYPVLQSCDYQNIQNFKTELKQWFSSSFALLDLLKDWKEDKTKFLSDLSEDWNELPELRTLSDISEWCLNLIQHVDDEQIRYVKRQRDRYTRKGLPPPSLHALTSHQGSKKLLGPTNSAHEKNKSHVINNKNKRPANTENAKSGRHLRPRKQHKIYTEIDEDRFHSSDNETKSLNHEDDYEDEVTDLSSEEELSDKENSNRNSRSFGQMGSRSSSRLHRKSSFHVPSTSPRQSLRNLPGRSCRQSL